MTGLGPQQANASFRFGVQQGAKLRAGGDPKRSQWNRVAAEQTPVNLAARDRVSAISRMFQEAVSLDCSATASTDHEDALKQPPVCDGRRMLSVGTISGPNSGKVRCFIPRTRLFGATAAVFLYNAVSWATAAVAVRR